MTSGALDLDVIEKTHYQIEWHKCGEDGTPDLSQPLPPFCGYCTDEEWVGAIEYGDTIDEGADVVSWPCEPLTLARAVRQRDERIAELTGTADRLVADAD